MGITGQVGKYCATQEQADFRREYLIAGEKVDKWCELYGNAPPGKMKDYYRERILEADREFAVFFGMMIGAWE